MSRRIPPLVLLLLFLGHAARAGSSTVTVPEASPQTATVPCSTSVRAEDSLWLVSTRCLGCPTPSDRQPPAFGVQRYENPQGWSETKLDQLQADTAKQRSTVIYVHGNREDWATAQYRGLIAYRTLVQVAGAPAPIRFVIWSWPSDQIRGPRNDVLAKAARSDYEAYYLAQFLAATDPQARAGLFGFSYGARIITGALHLLGGGTLVGLQLPEGTGTGEHQARVVLMAAALHDFWLLPDSAHGKCWSQIDRLLIQYNPCDRILRLYPHLDRCTRPQALGYSGFPWTNQLGDDAMRIVQQNVSCEIGNQHHALNYLESPTIMDQVQRYVLQQETSRAENPEPTAKP